MRLIFMRHAKAEHHSPSGDHGRQLTPRGRQRAALAGELLQGLDIQQAFVSTAARTRETFTCLRLGCPVEYLDALYQTHHDGVLEALAAAETPLPEHVLVVGHNPSMHSWAYELALLAGAAETAQISASFPTAAFAAFDLHGTSWDSLLTGEPPENVELLRVHLR